MYVKLVVGKRVLVALLSYLANPFELLFTHRPRTLLVRKSWPRRMPDGKYTRNV